MSLKLGPLTLKNPWLLAPMEAVTDVGFRSLCGSLGASLTFTEMVRGSSFARENRSTLELVDTYDEQTATGVQFLTKGPDELEKTLKKFFELREQPSFAHFRNIKAIDLNFGCPNPELIEKGLGPAMVKRTAKMEALFSALAKTVDSHDPSIAVGSKIRLGLNQREMEFKVASRLVPAANANLDFFTVHAKHAGQRGSEPADWKELVELRDHITIPFIGNGGALNATDARRMLKETKVDGVMLARGAIQNPWVFRALAGDGSETPTKEEVEAAWRDYKERAQRFHTKQKYLDFHEENFERLIKGSLNSRLD
jgi:tRNA-dihydrouridine synthase B